MVFLNSDELSFGNGVAEDGIELGMSKEASLCVIVSFLYFFEGRFHG
jgi:hypothetical protein